MKTLTDLANWEGVKHVINTAAGIGHYIGRVLVFLMMVLILLEISTRQLFNFSFGISDEYSVYFFIATVFLGLGEAFRKEGFVRVELVYNHYPKRFRHAIDLVFLIIALAVVVLLSYEATRLFMSSFVNDSRAPTPTRTPLFIPQMLIAFGLYIFGAVLLLEIPRAIHILRTEEELENSRQK